MIEVAQLHAEYCRQTGREIDLRFHEREWFELLRAYQFDAAKLGRDVALLVRYLKKMIAREKRNPGALKLSNFLQPDKFNEDLAEAKAVLKVKKFALGTQEKRKSDGGAELTDEAREKLSHDLRDFREGLRRRGIVPRPPRSQSF